MTKEISAQKYKQLVRDIKKTIRDDGVSCSIVKLAHDDGFRVTDCREAKPSISMKQAISRLKNEFQISEGEARENLEYELKEGKSLDRALRGTRQAFKDQELEERQDSDY